MSEAMFEGLDFSMVESDQIETLVAAAGIDATQAILDAFWQSNDELLEALRTQLAAANFVEAAKTAHALKGSAANLGAVHLSEQARMIEVAVKDSKLEDALASVESAIQSNIGTRAIFEKIVQSN